MGCLALLVVGLGASAAQGSPLDAEFTLDLTPEWQSALDEARLTVVDSWTDYGLGDLFADPPALLVEPLISAVADELVMEFPGAEPEGDDEIYGLSYNYAEDPDLSKKKVLLKKAEIDKGKEIWIILEDINGKRMKARLKADESGKKLDVDFPVWVWDSSTSLTFSFPRISLIVVFHSTGMLSAVNFFTKCSCARSLSRLCAKVTSTPILFRCRASVTALFPPPTIITFFPLKRGPSQVLQ